MDEGRGGEGGGRWKKSGEREGEEGRGGRERWVGEVDEEDAGNC